MPLRKPKKGESQSDYMGYCMHELSQSDTQRPQDQKVAICMDNWRAVHGGSKPKKKQELNPPDPDEGENQEDFMSRCVDELTTENEGIDENDAYDACNDAWQERDEDKNLTRRQRREREVKKIIARWQEQFGREPSPEDLKRLARQKQDGDDLTPADAPEPEKGEEQEEFLDRCASELEEEYPDAHEDDITHACDLAWQDARGGDDKSDRKVIHKTHSSTVSGMEFILSDEQPDRLGDVIEVAGWQLENFKKNPIALFNHNPNFIVGKWHNLRVEKGELRGHLEMAPEGTSERIDEIRKLVDAGILKAVSVGFRGLKSVPIKVEGKDNDDPFSMFFGPKRYTKHELVETSLVAVPANANALAVAKSLKISPATIDVVFGEHASKRGRVERRRFTGEHAARRNRNRRDGAMSLSQRIEDSQGRLVALRDELSTHLQNLDDTNVTDKDLEVTEKLNEKIVAEQKLLAMLQASEKNVAGTASAEPTARGNGRLPVLVSEHRQNGGADPSRFFAAPHQKANGELKPLDYLIRAGVIAYYSKALNRNPDDERRRIYGDDEKTRTVFDWIVRAATSPAQTTVTGWAAELVQQIVTDFMQLLYPKAILPRLSARGLSLSFGRMGRIIIPTRNATPTIAGSFVGEGLPIPVRQGAFASQTLTPKKMAVITTWTREIDEHSIPAIEGLLREAVQIDTGVAVDSVLVDANPATVIRPAGIMNGITPITGTLGGGLAAIVADMKALINALIASTKGNVRDPVLLMNPGNANAAIWAMAVNSGLFPFRAEVQAGNLGGIPIIDSGTVPLNTLILVDAADFVMVGAEAPRFEVSDQATLHEEDTAPLPIVPPSGTASAPVRSLWQTDSLALRLIWPINWTIRRAGVVAATTGLTW